MPSTHYTDYQSPPVMASWLNDADYLLYKVLGDGTTAPASRLAARSNLEVAHIAPRITVPTATTLDFPALLSDTDDLQLTGTTAVTTVLSPAGRVYRVVSTGIFILTNSANLITNTGGDLVVGGGDSFLLRATAANVVEVLCYSKASLRAQPAYPFAVTYETPPSTQSFILTLPRIVVQFDQEQVDVPATTHVMGVNQISDVWITPAGQYVYTTSNLTDYWNLPRYENYLHVCRTQTSVTKIQGIYIRRPTAPLLKSPTPKPFNYYQFKNQLIMPSVYVPWVNSTAVTKGICYRSSYGDLWTCEKPGVCSLAPPFPTYNEELNTGFAYEPSGTALFSFRGRSSYSGAWRLSARAGIGWYFSHIAAGIMAAKFPSEVKAYLNSAIFHLVDNWVSGTTYTEGRKVAGPLTYGWAWEAVTAGTATATIPFPAGGAGVSIGTLVTDGTIQWRAIGPYTDNTQKWFWYDAEPTQRGGKSPDSHDSYAACFVWAAWKYLAATNDVAWLAAASSHNGYTNVQIIKEVLYANMSTQLDPAAGYLTKVFQNDSVPFGGKYAASYFMDNCEVWAGFEAARKIFTTYSVDAPYAASMTGYRDSVLSGLSSLWEEGQGAWKYIWGLPTMAPTAGPASSLFYPLCMSQAWGWLWGVPLDTDYNYRALDYMATNYPHWWERNDIDDLLSLGAHHGLITAYGSDSMRRQILNRVEKERLIGGQADIYVMDAAYYFDIRDSIPVKGLSS